MHGTAAFLLITSLSASLAAQTPPAPETLEAQVKAQDERIRKLEQELEALKAALKAAAPAPAEAPPAQLGGAGGSAAKVMNPDISLNGDFLGAVGHNPVRPVPSIEMHEVELGVQSVIDPYARGDAFLSFGDSGVNVEEAFVTFTDLPGEVQAKVGKMRAAFGKVNGTHNHALSWSDRPLVTENLVGGEDGIDDMGVSLTRILPAPGDIFLEATAQVFRGNSSDLFKANNNNDLTYVGHLRNYQDLTENSNLEVGYSFAQGHNDLGHDFLTRLQGMDVSLRWKPLNRSIYNSFLWRTELVWSRREQVPEPVRAFGWYSSLDYRLDERWTVGTRFDDSQRPTLASQRDRGASAILTYWLSEFAQARGQYRFTRYAGNQDASELRLQLIFVMGAHGAHAF